MSTTSISAEPGLEPRLSETKASKSWRDVIAIHPAAELFPRMSESELRELGEDIKKNGLRHPIVLFSESGKPDTLLDGISRLDAMELVGIPFHLHQDDDWWSLDNDTLGDDPTRSGSNYHDDPIAYVYVDPIAFVLSANVHRRHLTTEQRLRLVDEVIKAKPNLSDRQIAKQTKVSPTTASKRRKKLEATGQVSTVDTSLGADGKEQPRRKPKVSPTTRSKSEPAAEVPIPRPQASPSWDRGSTSTAPFAFLEVLRAYTERASLAERIEMARRVLDALRVEADDLLEKVGP
jgi:hypothetical protein